MPRRNKSPYWLEQAIELRKRGDTLTQISNVILQPVSTIRYQLSLNLERDEYDSLCHLPNSIDGTLRTKQIKELREQGMNGNSIAKEVGVSRQYVYKLFRMWQEQEDALLDDEVEKNSYEYERTQSIQDYIKEHKL
jgi:orotate phosphoribosyltransferase-like protein